MGFRVYGGRSIRTRRDPIVYSCTCGERFRVEVYRAVESADRQAVNRLLEGKLNQVTCPSCNAVADVQVAVSYHDLGAPRLVLVLAEGLRHRELLERSDFFKRLAEDQEPPPQYVLDAPCVFGAAGLRALLQMPAAVPAKAAASEWDSGPQQVPVVRTAQSAPRSSSVASSSSVSAKPAPALKPKNEFIDDDSTPGAGIVGVPDARDAAVERWIAGREAPSGFMVDERVLVCAALQQKPLEAFIGGDIDLRVQLHRLPAYPLMAIALVPNAPVERLDDLVVVIPLDVARAAHRVMLERLGRSTSLKLQLYDSQYLPVGNLRIEAPLEENVRRLLSDAKDALDRLPADKRSFERAKALLLSPSYDRLGRSVVDLPDEVAASQRKTRAALSQLSRWSEPSAESYLVEIRSYPLVKWRQIRSKILRAAIDLGVSVPRALVNRARNEGGTFPAWHELLSKQVRAFSELLRERACDFSAEEEADNWKSLLRDCDLSQVPVDEAVRRMAASASKSSSSTAASPAAGEPAKKVLSRATDLGALETPKLLALLDSEEFRRSAALALCNRGETSALQPLFSAVKKMSRGEANVVLPALTLFGAACEKYFIDGLTSRNAYIRQGCALGLGQIKTPKAIAALVDLLLSEPTEIWNEVARALGDIGPPAVMPLAAQVRSATDEERSRLVSGMAHVVARGARAPVEILAGGRDQAVAEAAREAIQESVEVQKEDEMVRQGGAEPTVVRGFSRRYYQALNSDVELSGGDLEEMEPDNPGSISDSDSYMS